MNMVMEFLNMLLRIPRRGWREIRFLAVNNVDLLVSITSASNMLRGRKSDIMDFFPAPFTRKLRRPYSLLRVWTTSEFSPNLVVCRTMSSVLWVILFGLKILRYAQDDRETRMTGKKNLNDRVSCTVFQPFCHCAEGLASVGDGVLIVFGDVSQSQPRELVRDEDRVVAETAVT